jgi:hypothetical protein
VLGDDHPDTLSSASKLATDLRLLGEIGKATSWSNSQRVPVNRLPLPAAADEVDRRPLTGATQSAATG